MFDEKSEKWIQIYKYVTIALFFICIAIGILLGLLPFYITGSFFLDLVLWAVIGAIVGYIQLTANMLLIQFFNNVQIIREHVESNPQPQNKPSPSSYLSSLSSSAPDTSDMWKCKQ